MNFIPCKKDERDLRILKELQEISRDIHTDSHRSQDYFNSCCYFLFFCLLYFTSLWISPLPRYVPEESLFSCGDIFFF